MTIDKAIETIKYASAFNSENSPLAEALEMAIDALQYKQSRVEDKPLTKEEMIKYMVDGLPCWIETITAVGKPSGWGLAGRNHAIYQDFTNVELLYATYGTCWIAYSHPLKEI